MLKFKCSIGAIAIASALIVSPSYCANDWVDYGETAEGDRIELYQPSVTREDYDVFFTYRLTEKNGVLRLVKARSRDCFKSDRRTGESLNGKPRDWSVRSSGKWKKVAIGSDATINLLINVCRAALSGTGGGSGEAVPEPPVESINSLGYIAPDYKVLEIYERACLDAKFKDLESIRAGIWVRLVNYSNVAYDRSTLESNTERLFNVVINGCRYR